LYRFNWTLACSCAAVGYCSFGAFLTACKSARHTFRRRPNRNIPQQTSTCHFVVRCVRGQAPKGLSGLPYASSSLLHTPGHVQMWHPRSSIPWTPQSAKKPAEVHMQECGAVVSAQLTCVPEVASMVSLDRAVAPAIAGMMQLETPLQDLFAIARPCAGQTRDQTARKCYCSCCMLVLSHVQPDQGSNAL
jgi:hypothetical protein